MQIFPEFHYAYLNFVDDFSGIIVGRQILPVHHPVRHKNVPDPIKYTASYVSCSNYKDPQVCGHSVIPPVSVLSNKQEIGIMLNRRWTEVEPSKVVQFIVCLFHSFYTD